MTEAYPKLTVKTRHAASEAMIEDMRERDAISAKKFARVRDDDHYALTDKGRRYSKWMDEFNSIPDEEKSLVKEFAESIGLPLWICFDKAKRQGTLTGFPAKQDVPLAERDTTHVVVDALFISLVFFCEIENKAQKPYFLTGKMREAIIHFYEHGGVNE